MDETRKQRLAEFVEYAKTLSGDEKGEAQVFLDRLFRGFGREGYHEAGAILEHRVKKTQGGTAFADLVWKPVVLIEMKKRGVNLAAHLSQAFDYWVELVPNRPRYVILCNFDEFRIYDFDKDINEPQDTVTLDELPERYSPLNFLFKTNERPVFKVDREKVTRDAAALLATVYNRLAEQKAVGPQTAQRFILQMLVSLFSEDIGLLPKHFVTQLLDDCTDPPKAFDLLRGLFTAMNAKKPSSGGRFKDVPYFNGGIFSEPAPVELDPHGEIALLKRAASYNWAHVSPDIFGTIFQQSMGAEERHAFGAHYTAPSDIMKIVGPTIVQPWRTSIESAKTIKELRGLQHRLHSFRVLDPACGSGNFLYIAYRELKRIEKALIDRLNEVSGSRDRAQREFGFVTSKQFFGIDILPFAVELAKVTMTLAHKLSIDELHIEERALPLDNLDENIVCKDALIDGDGQRATWPEADVIIGNPPFLGAKRLKPERGVDYVNAVRKLYPEVPGMADYCVYWFRRAHDHLKPATAADPFTGRAGLVGTQNIRNNQSRVGGLDHVVKSGLIVEAVENQPWSGEANVHVSIANWVKLGDKRESDEELIIPSEKRLWSKGELTPALFATPEEARRPRSVTRGRRGLERRDKSFELRLRECDQINSALSDSVDASLARVLSYGEATGYCYTGQYPRHNGFMLDRSDALMMIRESSRNAEVVHPFLVGREVLGEISQCDRYVIDFQTRDLIEAQSYIEPFEVLKRLVLPYIRAKANAERRKTGKDTGQDQNWLNSWWLHFRARPELIGKIERLRRYVVCSRVTKRPIFLFVSPAIRPGDALSCFVFEDDYSFGILQSNSHWQWFIAKCSKLTERFRYTPESVFDTFPWPQSPNKKQIRAVAKAGREIRRIRDEALPNIKGGLRALYRTLELPGKNPLKTAHADLDAAVLDAYGFSARKDLLKQLLDLNLAVAKAIDDGETVTAPGVPESYGDPTDLITDDCIRP